MSLGFMLRLTKLPSEAEGRASQELKGMESHMFSFVLLDLANSKGYKISRKAQITQLRKQDDLFVRMIRKKWASFTES